MMNKQKAQLIFISLLIAFLLSSTLPKVSHAQTPQIRLSSGDLTFTTQSAGFRYGFSLAGRATVQPDTKAGLTLNGSPVSVHPVAACARSRCVLLGASAAGARVRLIVALEPHHAEIIAMPAHPGDEVRFVTAGAAPGYGLADHAVEQKQFSTLDNKQYNTDVTGFADDSFLSGQGITRLVSNFVIYPKQKFAEVLIDPSMKIVHTSGAQIVQGVVHSSAQVNLHYFFGTPHEIYAAYRKARNDAGYPVMTPKYPAFGVGWEAFGALGWDTNQKTVQESVDRYLAEGYPLRWIVIGSGFWPAPPEMHETTSFGFWDKQKYPGPRSLMLHFHQEGLQTLLGLRITFITTGPYSAEGLRKGYFLSKDGHAQVFVGGWPKLPYYLLDAHNPAALDWYMALVKRWQVYGIDGFKEDFYGYGGDGLRDDKVDPVNDRLMQEKQFVIERNGYLSSNGDLHRINDFNYDQDQDRGPVNALALAYSGFPLVYPDIVGGTFGEDRFSTQRTAQMDSYMMRNAQWAALHSSMGMGEPPWTFSAPVQRVMLQAAKLHARIAPYIFSNARRFAQDGYPWTMTPLPIAFPDDANVYGRGNAAVRGYEWLIGDAMLATPLYGNDYAHANTRDIYLPRGRWMDFDTGAMYEGGRFLRAFPLPPGKTPLFIGGSGVTLEAVNGETMVCVYPIAESATAVVTLPQSDLPVTVHVHGLAAGAKWKTVRVTDATGHELAVHATGFAFSFLPKAGETYTVQAIR
jgi:alpha-glucosidase (family GH31 glycosyl hydrolase)